MDGCPSDPKWFIMKLRANLGHAPAQGLEKGFVDSDRDNMRLASYADKVFEYCDVCRASEKAPHVPTAGSSAESMFSG